MTFIKNNFAYIAIAVLAFAIGIFVILPMIPSVSVDDNFFVSSAAAFGSGGCGSCDDPTTPTTPDDDPNPPTCDIKASLSVAEDGDTFKVTWNGTPSSADFWINGYKLSDPTDSANYYYDGQYDYMRFTMYGENSDGNCGDEVFIYKKAPGCTDSTADNYDDKATEDDGSCTYTVPGCTDEAALNYNENATEDDGSCDYPEEEVPGCTDEAALNYNENATEDDGSCDYPEEEKDPITCEGNVTFTADPTELPAGGGNVVLSWTTVDVKSVKINGEVVPTNDSTKTVSVVDDKIFVLVAEGDETTKGNEVSCEVKVEVADPEPEAPQCVSLTADKTSLPYGGGDVVLTWDTENATLVKLNGEVVAADDTKTVNVTNDITYTIVASLENGNDANACEVKIEVEDPVEEKDPITCEANANFTASPTSLGVGGGDVVLTWDTTAAKEVKLDGVVVAIDGNKTVSVTDDKTFTLEVTGNESTTGNAVSCPVSVTVDDPTPSTLTCSDVNFKASDNSVRKGDKVTLSWDWNSEVDSASIDNGIGSVSNNDSQVVTVNSDITYKITIVNEDDSVSCPVSIDVENGGGGGGGSSSPRCDLDVSDDKIRLGETVTLSWDTTNATEITITDDEGNIIVTTDNLLSSEKRDLFDDSIKVKPTKDTTYTLLAERGSKDRKCKVDVEVGGGVTVLETRDQEPRVAGISLTQLPYTGFEAGPMLTAIFYTLLTLWALFVAYVVVLKRDGIGGVSFAGAHEHNTYTDVSTDEAAERLSAAEAYVQLATPQTAAPNNLPTVADYPVVGYAAATETSEVEDEIESEFVDLENQAHAKRVLLSTDAMRYLTNEHGTGEKAAEALESLIDKAKVSFPSEDGWVVLNLARVESLMGEIDEQEEKEIADVAAPVSAGSLAEAIVTGNIIAAYRMIGHRPMVALSAAAADLDALYRMRNGETDVVSTLLETEAAKLTNEQLKSIIGALTGALDGTYTDEAEAVKVSIMKAVNVVA